MSGDWLLYGATGYTGRLIAREAAARGLSPVLAGRDETSVAALGRELGLSWRAFPLEPDALAAGLAGTRLVLHCAGPFVRTGAPMLAACLAARSHYLDITGEIVALESALAARARARAAGVVILPGVGFDVVPSDCLALRVAKAVPDATHLDLAFGGGSGWSGGTLKTMIESLPHMGAERRAGRIVPVAPALAVREAVLGGRTRRVVSIAWGDVATAFHTTGIPNIRTFAALGRGGERWLRRLARVRALAGARPLKRLLQAMVGMAAPAPRGEARAALWARAWRDGSAAEATLDCPEPYRLTALTALECVARVLGQPPEAGAWTPAGAFGEGLIGAVPGVVVGELRHERGAG